MIQHYPQMLLLDAGGPILFAILGGVLALIAFVIIWVTETIVLVVMKWASVPRCMLHVFLVNLVSGIVGLPLLILFGAIFSQMFASRTALPLVGTLAATFAISVAIEGGILLLFKLHPPHRTWRVALVANTTSYLFIAFLLIGRAIAD